MNIKEVTGVRPTGSLTCLVAEVERLREELDRQRCFAGDIAHDLRTPLTAMLLQASALSNELPAMPDCARHAVGLLVSSVMRMASLVEDLLELGTLDADEANLEPLDLCTCILTVLSELSIRVADLKLECDDGLMILADRRRLRRVLANLIANAFEHGDGRGVEVRAWRDTDGGVVDILDRGKGFPPGALDRIFDRCFSAGSRGSGLGLAIARAHAEAQGATLSAANRDGGGAHLRLCLVPATSWCRR